jgi:tetratricopeptide (TPR) repeat protein
MAMTLLGGLLALPLPLAAEQSPVPELPTLSGSLLGGYLAGRIAQDEKDLAAASELYRQALMIDPGNEVVLKQAFLTEAEAGNWERAALFADKVAGLESNHRVARIFLGVKAFKAGDLTEADRQLKEAGLGPIGELTATLARAWVLAAEGKTPAALDLLDSLKPLDWASFYRLSHRALIADLAGDSPTADAAYKELFEKNPKVMGIALAYARHASVNGNPARAREIIELHSSEGRPSHMLIEADREALDRGEKLSPYLTTAVQGLAEVFFGLGEALVAEGGTDIGMIYLQLALYLQPENALALASVASVQEQTRQYDRAIDTYARIGSNSALHFSAMLRRALNLSALERTDEAKKALLKLLEDNPASSAAPRTVVDTSAIQAEVSALPKLQAGSRGEAVRKLQLLLARAGYAPGPADGALGAATTAALKALQSSGNLPANGTFGPQTRKLLAERLAAAQQGAARVPGNDRRLQILSSLGNLLRSGKEFAEASRHYSEAITLIGEKPTREHWGHFYSRAVCYERLKRWPEAEADFKKALELDGEQPLVLNYLGYSWVDMNLNLEPALEMIRKAVRLKPDDGYFVDSLGWAYYRLGRFDEAVTELERAVELKPDDPVINDHLGDAYWQAGRRLEARFQWSQALTLKPEPEEVPKIEAKLRSGVQASATGSADGGKAKAATAGTVESQPVEQQ